MRDSDSQAALVYTFWHTCSTLTSYVKLARLSLPDKLGPREKLIILATDT